MAEHVAFTMAGLCSLGGTMGFAKRRSIPSLAAARCGKLTLSVVLISAALPSSHSPLAPRHPLSGRGAASPPTSARTAPGTSKTRAGLGVGALYGLGGYRIRTAGASNYGFEIAAGASAVLLASSLPRARKGPIPAALSVAASLALSYYGKKFALDLIKRPVDAGACNVKHLGGNAIIILPLVMVTLLLTMANDGNGAA
ncbi:hypothetical protein V8E36_007099 [Tilletia maclaganii]